ATIFWLLSLRTSVHYRAAPNVSVCSTCGTLVAPDSEEWTRETHTPEGTWYPYSKQQSMRKEVRRWPESQSTQTRCFPDAPSWQRQAVPWLASRPADW